MTKGSDQIMGVSRLFFFYYLFKDIELRVYSIREETWVRRALNPAKINYQIFSYNMVKTLLKLHIL